METITPDKMTPASAIEVPKVEDNTDYNSILSQTSAELQNNLMSTQSQADSILNNQNRVITDLNSQSALLANKDKELLDTEISLGVDTERENINKATEQLANLNAQSSQLNREAQAIPLQLQQELTGKGATKAGAQPIETARLRDNAIRALSIAQQSDIATAQLTGSSLRLKQAQDKAKQIIDLKYKPIEIKLQSLQAQYNANKEMLDRVDKKLSEQYKLKLDNQKEVLKIKREDEKQMSDLIIKARGQGASDDIIAKAMSAKTPMAVAVALGQYAGDYLQTQKLKAEIAKINAERTSSTGANGTPMTRDLGLATIQEQDTPAVREAKSFLQQFNAGALTLDEVYKNIGTTDKSRPVRSVFAELVAQQGGKRVVPIDSKMVAQIDAQLKNVNDLLAGEGYNYKIISGAVQGGGLFVGARLSKAKSDSLAIVDNILTNSTLQALIDAKEKGVTFGALSNAELNAVAASANRLNAAAKRDKETNKLVELDASEIFVKEDLETIRDTLIKAKGSATGQPKTETTQRKSDIAEQQLINSRKKSNTANMSGYSGYRPN